MTATVPFDDRQCQRADVDDLRLPMIRLYLKEVGSDLAGQANQMPLVDLCRQMNIVDGADEFLKPRNVGLLFFNEDPTRFMPGSQIEVVIFPTGPGGDEIIEKIFHGPIHEQLREALRYIENRAVREKVIKHQGRAGASRFFSYPMTAIEEALVNAMYHRGYDQREPVEVRINPDGIEIVSYPGPDPSIRLESLNGGKVIARRYRNRRIGEFLKELDLTEGRCTGIPKIRAAMDRNGSPEPRFSTDDGRTHFLVELPVHPEFVGVPAQDGVQDGVQDLSVMELHLLRTISNEEKSTAELVAALGYKGRNRNFRNALIRLQDAGLIELTIPDKPNSKHQKRRLTTKGQRFLSENGDV